MEDGDLADVEEDVVSETLPESLGLAGADGKFVRLVRRGAPLPARRTRTLAYPAGQTSVLVALYAGEAPTASENRAVAQARLVGLPATGGQLELVLQVAASGEATLTVQDKASRNAVRVTVPAA